MKKIQGGRIAKGPVLTLENPDGVFYDLITLKTKKSNTKETMKKIKENLATWMKNEKFDALRGETLDLAIVAYVNEKRMKQQDTDNIAKTVLDALKKNKDFNFKKEVYLFDDDSQIARLLVYKILREENEEYDTDSMIISFRRHDPSKQMILITYKKR